jgi:hypothetical protein
MLTVAFAVLVAVVVVFAGIAIYALTVSGQTREYEQPTAERAPAGQGRGQVGVPVPRQR